MSSACVLEKLCASTCQTQRSTARAKTNLPIYSVRLLSRDDQSSTYCSLRVFGRRSGKKINNSLGKDHESEAGFILISICDEDRSVGVLYRDVSCADRVVGTKAPMCTFQRVHFFYCTLPYTSLPYDCSS